MAEPNAKKQLLLLVDDDAEFRGACANSLGARNFEVIQAENGEKAKTKLDELVRGKPPRLPFCIVSDWVMEGGDGLTLLKWLRASPYREVPFVLISGAVDRNQLSQAIRLDADSVILKPFDMVSLVKKIDEATLLREAKRQSRS